MTGPSAAKASAKARRYVGSSRASSTGTPKNDRADSYAGPYSGVPYSAKPLRCCLMRMSERLRSVISTKTTRAPRRMAVAISPTIMRNPPSPVTQQTGTSGRHSLAAMAAGMPNPIDDQPLVISRQSGSGVGHCWPMRWRWAPTSHAMMPPSGRASRRPARTARGPNEPGGGRSRANIASRFRATSAGSHAVGGRSASARCASAVPRSPTTSPASVYRSWSRSAGAVSMCSTGTSGIQSS